MIKTRWTRAVKLYALTAGIWAVAAVVAWWSCIFKGSGLSQPITWSALTVAMGALAVRHRDPRNEGAA